MNLQVLINKLSCAKEVYKMAIKRRRVVVRNLVRTSVEGAAVKHSLTLSKSQRPVFGWSSKSRFSQGAKTRQPNLGVDSGAHDRTTEKKGVGARRSVPGPAKS